MYVSTVRLYHPALWKMLYSYRVLLVTLRSVENLFHTMSYVGLRGPFLIAWTRLPITRDRRPPLWSWLAEVVAPLSGRASIKVGAGQMGSMFALAGNVEDMSSLQSSITGTAKPPSASVSVLGAFLRGYFAALGPAFIKFGQIMSMREELPPSIRGELALLQDKLPAMPYKQVKKIIEREMDRPIEEVFEYVEEVPIAAASLAQVHRAKLRKERTEVAIKIQRPYLAGIAALDTIYLCDIMVLGLVRRLLPTMAKGADFGCFTTSYRESLTKEIDLNLEERTQSRFRKLVLAHPIYSQCEKIARTYREYSTTKMLTMELVKNYYRLDRILDDLTPEQLLDFATTRIKGVPDKIPLQLIYLQMALGIESLCHWGLTHGDMHLGNMYALAPDSECDHWRIFLCDFGMMIDETEPERIMSIESNSSMAYYGDGSVMARALIKQSLAPLSEKNKANLINCMVDVTSKYIVDVKDGAERIYMPRTQRGTQTTIVSEVTYASSVMGLKMSPYNWLLLKNFSYLCNMGAALWTTFNVSHVYNPHIKKYIKDVVFHDLEGTNITNLRNRIPEILSRVREYDRGQILQALETGEMPKPLEIMWAYDWDLRQVEGPRGQEKREAIEEH